MSEIFISYSHADIAKARILADALKPWAVFWDRKIPAGKSFDQVIEEALERAKCVIVLWSRSSVESDWVKVEAGEGKSRGILVPAMIDDDVKIPLEFRRLHAPRLTDWRGESGHAELEALKVVVAALLGVVAQPEIRPKDPAPLKTPVPEKPVQTSSRIGAPEGVYVDPKTGLMWTIDDNGADINWTKASQYAKELRLGGFSDWRLPSIEELEKLYDPQVRNDKKIQKPLRLTQSLVWSATTQGSGSAFAFIFFNGRRYAYPLRRSMSFRTLCVRGSGE